HDRGRTTPADPGAAARRAGRGDAHPDRRHRTETRTEHHHHSTGGTVVLVKLLRSHLRPYTRTLWLIVLLQLVQTIAMLYLPTLNADIVDNGLIKGDMGYILRVGAVMLAITLVQIAGSIGAVFFGART